jgi:hypothetical protein
VKAAHRDVFPSATAIWQPGAASRVWAILHAAGGRKDADALTAEIARMQGIPKRNAHRIRNNGLAVLEAFELIEIDRIPRRGGSGQTCTYGRVRIVNDNVNVFAASRKREEAKTKYRLEGLLGIDR